MKISVIGSGRWGGFITWYLDRLGHEVAVWGRKDSPHYQKICRTRTNGLVCFSDSVELCTDLTYCVERTQVLVISISSQSLRSFLTQLSGLKVDGKLLVLCMKGIEEHTGDRLTQIVHEVLGNRVVSAIWVGPGHVQEFTRGVPNCMIIDSDNDEVKRRIVRDLSSDLIRFYYGTDLIGNEIGAASKNVIGIAAGMLDGLGQTSLKGALMARGAREISRLIKAMGGNEMTAYGLSHLGDYEATVFSLHSHNRRFGELFVKGEPYTELAEGVSTVKALMLLKERYHVDLPICEAVYKVIHLGEEPKSVLSGLFLRSLKDEF